MTERTGRRPGDPDTRGVILAAARAAFAGRGYTAASIRQVATAADVDPALVMHYFGSKRQLFITATGVDARELEGLIETLAAADIDTLGERLARFYVALIDMPDSPVLAILRSAMSDDEAARTLREFVTEELIGRIVARLDSPDAALRGGLIGAQLVGVAVLRRAVGVEPLASVDAEVVVAWLAPTLQRYLKVPTPEVAPPNPPVG